MLISKNWGILGATLACAVLTGCNSGSSSSTPLPDNNIPPVAVATWPSSGSVSKPVSLNASGSFDPDGDVLTYKWTLTSKPAGSSASLPSSTNTSIVSFTPDVPGSFGIRLVVNDGKVDSQAYTGVFTALANQAPTAAGYWNSSAPVLLPVTLDASGSSDPDGDTLTYKWSITTKPSNSSATLPVSTTSSSVQFVPDATGDFTIQLVVNDGKVDSTPFTKTISIYNTKPVAAIAASLSGISNLSSLSLGTTVKITGGGSTDADGHQLSYAWDVVAKPATSSMDLSNATGQDVDITLDAFGEYTFQLVVNDGWEDSLAATFQLAAKQEQVALDFQVIDAEYSEQLNRIVMVAADPARLITFDPSTRQFTELALPLTPSSVSVSPSGTYAAVGHNAYVSYVNLSTNTLVKTLSVSADVLDVVLADNGYIYAFPRIDQWESIYSINISTGAQTDSGGWTIYAGTKAKLHPSGTAMYGADNGLSPSDIEKYDISKGTATYLYDSPYHGDYAMCGDLWFSEDGSRIFTACGNVFRSSTVQAEDMLYNGALEGMKAVESLDHSQETGIIAAIPGEWWDDTTSDATVRFFEAQYLGYQRTDNLAMFLTPVGAYAPNGKFVFLRSDGKQYFVIARADGSAGMLHDYAILLSEVSN